jgi:nicotinamide-nucleotide amidase
MKAAILTVGDEILIGQIVDTNSAWIGTQLNDIGIRVNRTISLADDYTEITEGIRQAINDHDIVFMTGGLGPTKDDITKKAIADYLGVEMYFDQGTFDRIHSIFERMGRTMSPHHHDQCLMPESVHLLRNSMGTAPGMRFEIGDKLLFSMPGVPYEMKTIMTDEIIPYLDRQGYTQDIHHHTILTSCTGETQIENMISDLVDALPDGIKIAYLPGIAAVRVRVSGYGVPQSDVEHHARMITARLGDIVYGEGQSSLPLEILKLATSKRCTVATAESCTGGLIAHKLVSPSGASAYFKGGIVAYSNDIKTQALSVSQSTLDQHGTVSEQTVIEMAKGCLKALESDIAISISGIAGPDGGTEEKPVGTIWICVAREDKQVTKLLKAGKDRLKNMEIASIYAMDMLRRFMIEY